MIIQQNIKKLKVLILILTTYNDWILSLRKTKKLRQFFDRWGWTTTPWTLHSNLFLAFNPKIIKVEVEVQFKEQTEAFNLGEPRLKPV